MLVASSSYLALFQNENHKDKGIINVSTFYCYIDIILRMLFAVVPSAEATAKHKTELYRFSYSLLQAFPN